MGANPELKTSNGLTPEEVQARTKIADDFYTVFSNQVRISASGTEFRIFFGENYPDIKGEILVTEKMSIVMTPAQAKNLADKLSQVVKSIESMFGKIPEITNFRTVPQEKPIPDVEQEL